MKRGVTIPAELQAEIKRRWLANESVVAIARALNICRNTVAKYSGGSYTVAKASS